MSDYHENIKKIDNKVRCQCVRSNCIKSSSGIYIYKKKI